jgi:serine/threonine protein kinase
MAAVYAATHRNGSRAALKILHTEFARDAGIRERFLREGYVANKIDHPGASRSSTTTSPSTTSRSS